MSRPSGSATVRVSASAAASRLTAILPPRNRAGSTSPGDHGRIGHGGLAAAAPVAGRTRNGACGTRPDMEPFGSVEIGDRSAAGANRSDVGHRDSDGNVPGDVRLFRMPHRTVGDDGDVGRRSADVERDQVGPAEIACETDGRGDTARRAAADDLQRFGTRDPRRHDAAVGLDDPGHDGDSVPPQACDELVHHAAHDRRQARGYDRRGGAFVLLDLGIDVMGQRDVDVRRKSPRTVPWCEARGPG